MSRPVAGSHPWRCRAVKRNVGEEVGTLADDKLFRHLLAASMGDALHEPSDLERAVGNTLKSRHTLGSPLSSRSSRNAANGKRKGRAAKAGDVAAATSVRTVFFPFFISRNSDFNSIFFFFFRKASTGVYFSKLFANFGLLQDDWNGRV